MDFSKIRLMTINDVEYLSELFVKVTDQMIIQNIHQWNYTYPKQVHILQDIKNESGFVWVENGIIAACISLDTNQDSQYTQIRWHSDEHLALVIHRLAVHPDFQGLGISKKLCHFAEFYAHKMGINCIRLDAYSENKISNQLYLALGYKQADGFCYFHGNDVPFYCYDKIIGK
ncbi:MAG: GNAT family N-acetyltransferase [Saprospiraceae bacterium]|nr:GNAT family N-acetyltransferase [Saprospiraceae bacterium]